jgi:hypothetical protein
MPDDPVRTLLNEFVDREIVVDVEREWNELLERAAREPAGAGAGSDRPRGAAANRRSKRPPVDDLRQPFGPGKRLVLRSAAVVVVAGALAVALTFGSVSTSGPRHEAAPTTTTTMLNRPFVYRPTGPLPPSFVVVASDGSSQVLEVYSTDGTLVRTLVNDPGLLYAQNVNGVVASPDGRQLYYLDLRSPSPPGPGIGVYRVPVTGGRSSLVAIGLDPAISTDGRLLVLQPYGPVGGGSVSSPAVGAVDLATGQRSDFALPALFGDRSLAGDVVIGLAWLAGEDSVAVLLQPQSHSSPCGEIGPVSTVRKCPPPPPPPPTTLAILGISDVPGTPAATALGLVAAPKGFAFSLTEPGPLTGSIVLVGRHGGPRPASDQVFMVQLLPRPAMVRDLGQLPLGCSPLAFDSTTGAALCQPTAGTANDLEIVRLGRPGPTLALHMARQLMILNATW